MTVADGLVGGSRSGGASIQCHGAAFAGKGTGARCCDSVGSSQGVGAVVETLRIGGAR